MVERHRTQICCLFIVYFVLLTLHSAQMHSAEVSSLLLSENSTECLSYGCKPHLRRGSIILRIASGDWFSNPFLFFCLVSPHCLLQLISLSCYLSQWRRHVQPPTPQKLFSLLSLICSYHHDFASNWMREHRNSCSSFIDWSWHKQKERIINILGIPSLTLNKKPPRLWFISHLSHFVACRCWIQNCTKHL